MEQEKLVRKKWWTAMYYQSSCEWWKISSQMKKTWVNRDLVLQNDTENIIYEAYKQREVLTTVETKRTLVLLKSTCLIGSFIFYGSFVGYLKSEKYLLDYKSVFGGNIYFVIRVTDKPTPGREAVDSYIPNVIF